MQNRRVQKEGTSSYCLRFLVWSRDRILVNHFGAGRHKRTKNNAAEQRLAASDVFVSRDTKPQKSQSTQRTQCNFFAIVACFAVSGFRPSLRSTSLPLIFAPSPTALPYLSTSAQQSRSACRRASPAAAA